MGSFRQEKPVYQHVVCNKDWLIPVNTLYKLWAQYSVTHFLEQASINELH